MATNYTKRRPAPAPVPTDNGWVLDFSIENYTALLALLEDI